MDGSPSARKRLPSHPAGVWNYYRPVIEQLFPICTLAELMGYMEAEYNFFAT